MGTLGPVAAGRRLLALDRALLCLARRRQGPRTTHCMRALTHLGDTGSWLTVTLVLAALGQPGLRCALLLALAASTAVAASQVLKRTFRRPRPAQEVLGLWPLAEVPDAFSFPSGHTAVAFSVAVALVGEGLLGLVLLPLACGIGVSRVYLGAHYPLDVLVGAAVGASCGWLARGLLEELLPLSLHAFAVAAATGG